MRKQRAQGHYYTDPHDKHPSPAVERAETSPLVPATSGYHEKWSHHQPVPTTTKSQQHALQVT
jgi:hypothetical protein